MAPKTEGSDRNSKKTCSNRRYSSHQSEVVYKQKLHNKYSKTNSYNENNIVYCGFASNFRFAQATSKSDNIPAHRLSSLRSLSPPRLYYCSAL